MQIKFILLFVFALFASISKADGRKGTYIWPPYQTVTIPDSLKNEMAIYVNNITTLDFMDSGESEVVIFKRIYINSEEAAEKYSKKEMYVSQGGRISMLAARTLKADGVAIELEGNQIIETYTKEKNKYGTNTVRKIQLIYPNLEVGDIIDIAYQIDFDRYLYSNLMYLEDDLPSLYSRISLRNMSVLDITAYSLNGIPAMKSSDDGGIKTVSWEKHGVKAMETDYFNALPPDAPSFVYILWMRGEDLNYGNIYEFDERTYPYNYNSLTSITDAFIEDGVIEEGESHMVQLKKIIHYFETDFDWNYSQGTDLVNQTMGMFQSNKIDVLLFQRYLIKFFTENKIRYEKGFTKDLLDGYFEHGFVSLEQISDRYLLVYDEENNSHFLFPPRKENQFYYLDEIPFYIEGNQSVALYGERGYLKEQFSVGLPESQGKMNRHRAYVSIELTEDKKVVSKRRDQFSGHYSFLTRNDNKEIWLNELGVISDSAQVPSAASVKEFYPYKAEYRLEEDTVEILTEIEDSLYWLDVSSMLPLGVYQSDELDEDYGDYLVLPFLKQNEISFFVNAPNGVSFEENEKEIAFANDIGSIKATVYEMEDASIKINYVLEVKKRYISGKSEVKAFKVLMQQYADVLKKKWVLKF